MDSEEIVQRLSDARLDVEDDVAAPAPSLAVTNGRSGAAGKRLVIAGRAWPRATQPSVVLADVKRRRERLKNRNLPLTGNRPCTSASYVACARTCAR